MRVVLAGGGTTGHISPMLATAVALAGLDDDARITCVGTPAGLETTLVPQAGFDLRLIPPVPLPRQVSPELVTMPVRLAGAVRRAGRILREARADVVVGFGGYAALPVFLAARLAGVPVVVHEANAVPGLANRVAARFAARVLVTFANTGLPRQQVVGMPIAARIAGLDRAGAKEQARAAFGLDPQLPVLLVSGGSQGARTLNQATITALPDLARADIAVLHITGQANFDTPVDTTGIAESRYVRRAYVNDMATAYAAADMMLARAGAATVAETAMVGLPAIFVPLPHGNGEQAKNAAGSVAAGAGILVKDAELTPARLVSQVRWLTSGDRLARMSRAGTDLMPRDAAEKVAREAMAAATTRRRKRQ